VASSPTTWQGKDVEATALEKQLGQLWKQLAGAGGSPVRTHVFNLVVYTTSREQALAVIVDLEALERYHPSRTIVLIADRAAADSTIDAELGVQCDSGFGSGRVACFERLLLTVRGRAADHLASIVAPLLLPELPTYLWWPGQPLFRHRNFNRLLSAADQLVIDSAQFESPGEAFADLSTMCSSRFGVNDFNWARLTPWREVIAQFFDAPTLTPYVHGIREIRAEFGADPDTAYSGSAALLLILGWLASRLGWKPETTFDRANQRDVTLAVLQRDRLIPIALIFRDHGREAAGTLVRLEMDAEATDCPPASFQITRADDQQNVTVRTLIDGECRIQRVVPLGSSTAAELLADELQVTGKDVLYEEVVRAASLMAGREAWRPQ
jgi:glucose-6-phosphate dehydrogenase assembly protein OpcA